MVLSNGVEGFLAVAQAGSLTMAASRMGLTQTAMTQRIRALETLLNTTLFIRSRRGMILTKEGEVLLRCCQMGKDLEGQFLAHIRGESEHRETVVTISGPSTA